MWPRMLRLLPVILIVISSLGHPQSCRADAADKRVAPHPLDPLSREEIAAATTVLKDAGKVADSTRFVLLHLHEPPKEKVLAYRPGQTLPRQAFVVLYDWDSNTTSEAVVDVAAKKLLSWKNVPKRQPAFLPEDDHPKTAAILRADPSWREAMTKRGIKDIDKIDIRGWPVGPYADGSRDGHRRTFATMFAREYGPIEDLFVHVDLTAKKIVKLEDRGVDELRRKRGDFVPLDEGDQGEGPEGPSSQPPPRDARYQVDGNEVRWGHWRFRFGLHARSGLVLHTVGYEDGGKVRPILYRGCLSEMVVPYGDPNWIFWCPFDAGEYGMGVFAKSPLNYGLDAPKDAAYFSAWLHDRKGKPVEVPRAVALYERDGGVLWRHGRSSRRARQLVLTSFVRVEEYDYGFNWIFHEDGVLEVKVLLTGRMNVKMVERAEDEEGHDGRLAFGRLVEPRLEAPNHQHFFNFRLDLDVDGAERNSVMEMNVEPLPQGPDNPLGNAFVMKATPLRGEREARRRMKLSSNRKWMIANTCASNALGQPTGYVLIPGENSVPHAAKKSFARRHASFINHHLWVTPYRAEEQYAAGDYVNDGRPGEGLPKWTSANRAIEDTDVVVWYTLGVTHIPRPEEWPLMPVHRAGFKLVPAGFFARNPAMKRATAK
ncbi:MAG TPA: primary-amine oxidase [Gemmataceae bacterium]|nr:primary-amine oxidase [Gemmataceae bacterium]